MNGLGLWFSYTTTAGRFNEHNNPSVVGHYASITTEPFLPFICGFFATISGI